MDMREEVPKAALGITQSDTHLSQTNGLDWHCQGWPPRDSGLKWQMANTWPKSCWNASWRAQTSHKLTARELNTGFMLKGLTMVGKVASQSCFRPSVQVHDGCKHPGTSSPQHCVLGGTVADCHSQLRNKTSSIYQVRHQPCSVSQVPFILNREMTYRPIGHISSPPASYL